TATRSSEPRFPKRVPNTATAKSSPLTPEHYDLDTALGDAGRCYNRILQSLPSADTSAIWEHHTFQWRDNFSQQ
ncbi:hypothetical protein M3D96_15400, partial [Dietzia cinnamea]|nr:hypothetical protein [Dietzia cinnamea]